MDTTKSASSRWKRVTLGVFAALSLFALFALITYGGGGYQQPGVVSDAEVPGAVVEARAGRQADFVDEGTAILFGDLHVHTTYSADAFMRSLPLLGGRGLHPPADACDYARFCSSLDFFAITDHAESLTSRHWQDIKQTVRSCNAVAAADGDPDLFAFTGWEWSQVGETPEDHFGHKNVIFPGLEDDELPARPIGSRGMSSRIREVRTQNDRRAGMALIPLLDFENRDRYMDVFHYGREIGAMGSCPPDVDTRELPLDCREAVATPAELHERLDSWGFPALVIPHGTTWGFYTPPGYAWGGQPVAGSHDPDRQRLIEVYSGHGNSEEHRPYRAVEFDESGAAICPEPSEGHEPCCWRAGEIVRGRCGDVSAEQCERRVVEARAAYLDARAAGHLTIPGSAVEDWGNCGQCTDCFAPSFNHRPGGSVQYILARGDFSSDEAPAHPTLGFIASSDNHTARPGTGYKERDRRDNTEATGPVDEAWRDRVFGAPTEPTPEAEALTRESLLSRPVFSLVHLERQASFFMTGGLVAVHGEGRSREAVWEALQERRVYGTSGDRILLHFDLLNGPTGSRPMGAEVALGTTPRFRVRAAGAYPQLPGCPDWATSALSAERLDTLCLGECYHPGGERRRITRVEVVRIRPQMHPDESIDSLIDDPFVVLPCPPGGGACDVSFEDPSHPGAARDALYYVRAIQEPTPAVNAGHLRCEGDDCEPCYGDFRTPRDEDCLGPNEERAWSSPIYVHFPPDVAPVVDPQAAP